MGRGHVSDGDRSIFLPDGDRSIFFGQMGLTRGGGGGTKQTKQKIKNQNQKQRKPCM